MSGAVDHTNLWRIDPKMLCNHSMIRDSKWACGWGCHDRFKPNFKFPNTLLTMAFSRDLNTSSARDELFLDTVVTTNGYHFTTQDSIFDTHHQDNYSQYYQPVEDPWFSLPLPPPPFSHPAQGNGSLNFVETVSLQDEAMYHHIHVDACVSDRDHPVEDPWLLYPTLEPSDPDAVSVFEIPTISKTPQDTQNLVNLQEHPHQVSDKLVSGKESNVHSKEATVSTEILINCSVCTMQRIAVLEDGNLVELLLEPVKTNVQCDSVYLGVVTKLVPHMGGAFVNIGSSRPSLMDINSSREPFLFFPFDTTKGSDINGSSSWIVGKNSDSSQIRKELVKEDDAELSDVDTEVDFEDDDFAEHEIEDDESGDNVGGFAYRLNGNVKNAKVQPDVHVSSVQGDKTTQSPRAADEIWALVRKGTKIVVQVVKEGLGTKGPTLTAYPKLRSRFWVLITRCNRIGVSKKISGVERTRLRVIAKSLQPPGFGVTVRTVAAGRSVEELKKDLEGLLSTWRHIMEDAKSAALAADEGVEGAVPVILHQAMGQTLSVVQDYFGEKVKRMVVDSPRTYHEVTNYLQDIAPDLCDRVELHRKKVPLFDEFNLEEEINNILNKRVSLPNGGSLVIEQTEALVSIDVNGGHGMFGQGASQEKAIVDVNLAAAKQIARELRLRDIGGIIVVDFIDMMDDSNKRLIYEEIKKAVERDRSVVKVSELSKHGLMEITRKRVRPSVTFMISEPCTCCHGTGRIEALETSFSKIEHEICSLLATMDQKADPESPKSWPRLLLRVDANMCDYLTSGKKTRLATLSSSLKVWILLKVARSFTRGAFELKLLADEKANNDNQESGVFMLPLGTETSKLTKRTKLFPVRKWKAGRKR